MRQLITLTSAGRNRIIVIRRELLRIKDASSSSKPHRIERRRVLLTLSPSPATDAAAKRYRVVFSGGLPLRLCFGLNGDGPGKAEQLARNSRHFHHHPSQMSIAGLGNAASWDAVAAGIFTQDQAAVAHQLTGTCESAQRAGFGQNGDRCHLRNAAQRLQGSNNRIDLFGCRDNGLVDRLLQAGDPLADMMHFTHIVQQRGCQRRLLEMHMRIQLRHVLGSSLLFDISRSLLRTMLVLFGIFARPQQILPRLIQHLDHCFDNTAPASWHCAGRSSRGRPLSPVSARARSPHSSLPIASTANTKHIRLDLPRSRLSTAFTGPSFATPCGSIPGG